MKILAWPHHSCKKIVIFLHIVWMRSPASFFRIKNSKWRNTMNTQPLPSWARFILYTILPVYTKAATPLRAWPWRGNKTGVRVKTHRPGKLLLAVLEGIHLYLCNRFCLEQIEKKNFFPLPSEVIQWKHGRELRGRTKARDKYDGACLR